MAYDREEAHARLFAVVREGLPANLPRADEYLTALQREADNTFPGWGDRLIAFLRGLWAAGVIDIDHVNRIECELFR